MADTTNPFSDPNFGSPTATPNPFSDPDFGKSDGIPRRIADVGLSFIKNAPQLAQTPYEIADAASGGALDRASTAVTSPVADLTTRVGDALTGNKVGQVYGATSVPQMFGDAGTQGQPQAPILGSTISQGFAQTDQSLGSLYSKDQQAANQKVADANGFLPTVAASVQNPSTIVNGIVGSLPLMLGQMRVLRGVASAAGLRAATEATEAGLAPEAVSAAHDAAIDKFATGAPGIATQMATDFGINGAQQGAQAKEAIESIPEDELAQSPMYQQLLKTMSPQDARDKLASNGQFKAFVTAGVLAALTTPLHSSLEGKAATAGLRDAATQNAARDFLGIKSTGKAVALNAVQGGLQGAAQAIGTNEGMTAVDPNADLTKGLGSSVASNALMAAPIGGALHVAGELGNGVVHTAEGVPIDPATGPLSAAAATSIRNGTDPTLALPGPSTVYPGGPMIADATGTVRPATYADMSQSRIMAGIDADNASTSSAMTDNHLQHLQDLGHTYPLEIAQQAAQMLEQRSGTPMTVAKAPDGDYAPIPTGWMSDKHIADNADVQPPSQRLALPNPDRPTGGFVVDANGNARPKTARDDAIRKNTQDTIDEQQQADVASGNTPDVRDANKRRLGELEPRANPEGAVDEETDAAPAGRADVPVDDAAGLQPDGERGGRAVSGAEAIEPGAADRASNAAGEAEAATARPAADGGRPSEDDGRASEEENGRLVAAVDEAAKQAATSPDNDRAEPTDAQKEAGNYAKGHVALHGLDISIENPVGSTRSGVSPDGKPWSNVMTEHYGYIRGTVGKDGDHLDAFIGPKPASERVFVVDQSNAKGRFDEHKIMLGYDTADEARAAYYGAHGKGWKGLQALTETNVGDLKRWIANGATKAPFGMQARAGLNGLKSIEAIPHSTKMKRGTATAVAAPDATRPPTANAEKVAPGTSETAISEGDRVVVKRPNGKTVPGVALKTDETSVTVKSDAGIALKVPREQVTKEATDAVDQANREGGVQQERGSRNEGGKASEAGGGDRVQRGEASGEEAQPEKVEAREPVATRISGTEITAGLPTRRGARDWARENLQGKTFVNAETGQDIAVSKEGIAKALHGASLDQTRSMAALPQLIERAMLIRGEPDRQSRSEIVAVQKFYAPLSIADREYGVRLTVRRTNMGDRYYTHEITSLELGPPTPAKVLDSVSVQTEEASPDGRVASERPRPVPPVKDGGFPEAAEPKESVPDTRPVGNPSIEDTGEKIGGARKDRWKERGLDVSDLDAMSESEGATLATKANVWKPDYAALHDAGLPAEHTALIKGVYDKLATKPRVDTPEGRRDYVKMMQAVREVYGDMLPQAINDPALNANPRAALEHANAFLKQKLGLFSKDFDEVQAGKKLLFSVYKGRTDPFAVWSADQQRAAKLTTDGFPGKVDPWKKRFEVRDFGGPGITERGVEHYLRDAEKLGNPITEQQLRDGAFFVQDKMRRPIGIYATREDAEAGAKAAYERALQERGDATKMPERPALDHLKREGLENTIDRDVTPSDFLDKFGFRGVEFGNYAAQDERQRILNMAHDGLSDLAKILNVPPKALSLNGTLGMAFGARGSGRALAHYEPGKLVINLTKTNGGGSMAHEWAHAFDHYLGELDRSNAYEGNARGASGWYGQRAVDRSNLRPEVADAVQQVMSAITGGRRNPTQFLKDAQALSGKPNGYWSRPTELFARSFESHVFDRLVAMGAKSDYLVHGVEQDRFANKGYPGNPYPTGEERVAINKAFDHLAEVLKTRGDNDALHDVRPGVSTRSAMDDHILTAAREGTTAKPLLEQIAKDSATPYNRLLARALLDRGVDSTVNVGTTAGHRFKYSDLNAAAAYRPSADSVTLFSDRNAEKHLLHELVHAATVDAIRAGGVHAEELDRLVREVKNSGEIDASLYGLRDNYEFVAEAFSNPAFQDALRGVQVTPGSKTSLWDGFVNLVKRILGVKDGTALSEALRIGANLMKENRSLGDDIRSKYGDAAMADIEMPKIVGDLTQKFHDIANAEKSVSWWSKTVGTMYHLAQTSEHFKPVFDLGQRFIRDTSQIATSAMNLAPDVLPSMSMRSVFSKGTRPDDMRAASKAFFQGTREGERYDDATLRSRFGLNDKQVDLFNQARATTERMLDETLASEIARMTRKTLDPATLAEMKASPQDAARIAVEALGNNKDMIYSIQEKVANMQKLKDEGYAPLSRYGQYTSYAVDKDGKQLFYGMHESIPEREAMARALKAEFPDAIVTTGELSENAWKSFQGMNPDTIELFAQALGVDGDTAFQEYIRKALNNRSTLKRLAHRATGADGLSGLEGYSDDLPRVLASFVTSSARMASKNHSMLDMLEAVQAIPKEKGQLIDVAKNLHDYLANPSGSEAPALRGFLYSQFIGGSIASALTNMTQPLLQTFPRLSEWGAARAAKELTDAARIAATGAKVEPDLAAALKQAELYGELSPQELHQLHAQSMGGFASNPVLRKAMFVWGSFFGAAESFNRKVTFIAGYRVGKTLDAEQLKKEGVSNAFEFAEKMIQDTQGVYNRGNRPQWARGAVGATLFTFKQFSVQYLEFLKRLPLKQQALAGAMLTMAAGVQGLPFAEDLEDLIDTIGQSLGYDTNSKEALRNAAVSILGEGAGHFVANGVSSLPGVPLDIQGRVGLSNLIPGTALLKPSNPDKMKEAFEALGPVGAFVNSLTTSVGQVQAGNWAAAAKGALPLAVQNAVKALDMEMTGSYRDSKGRTITKTTDLDAVIKGIGFQPQDVARAQSRISDVDQDISLNQVVKGQIMQQWAQGMYDNNPSKIRDAVEALGAWNRKNPTSTIQIVPASVMAMVRNMAITADVRTIKGAPRTMRGAVALAFQPQT